MERWLNDSCFGSFSLYWFCNLEHWCFREGVAMKYKVFWCDQVNFDSQIFFNKKRAVNYAAKQLLKPFDFVRIDILGDK